MSYLLIFVIPGLTRNPVRSDWIPAFAGMTIHRTYIMQNLIAAPGTSPEIIGSEKYMSRFRENICSREILYLNREQEVDQKTYNFSQLTKGVVLPKGAETFLLPSALLSHILHEGACL